MEPNRPDQPQIEVMDTGHPPSRLERWASSLAQRRGVKLGGALVAALLVVGLWVVFTPEEEPAQAETDAAKAPSRSTGIQVVPPQGRPVESSPWKVSREVVVKRGPDGSTVTFHVANRSSQPQDPRVISVSASFVNRPTLTYSSSCESVQIVPPGHQPVHRKVAPGQRVLVRCTDTTKYAGAPARIDRKTVVVKTTPCEDSEGRAGL